jgi:hypothetical protein
MSNERDEPKVRQQQLSQLARILIVFHLFIEISVIACRIAIRRCRAFVGEPRSIFIQVREHFGDRVLRKVLRVGFVPLLFRKMIVLTGRHNLLQK